MGRFTEILFKGAISVLMLWGGTQWLGLPAVALAVGLLALYLAGMSLDSSNRHTEELKRLREQIAKLEQNLNDSHDRSIEEIERMEERLRRFSNRLDDQLPVPGDGEY